MSITYEQGRYRVRVAAQKFGENDNGKLCIAFTVVPFERLERNEWYEVDGETLGERSISFYFVSEENARISVEQLRSLGWEGNSFADLADPETGWSLIDTEQLARCEHESYADANGNERTTERWRFSVDMPSMADRVKPASKIEAKKLDAKFGSILKVSAPPMSGKTPLKPTPKKKPKPDDEPAPDADDEEDIPF